MVPGVNGSVGSIRCFESNPDDLALTGLKLVNPQRNRTGGDADAPHNRIIPSSRELFSSSVARSAFSAIQLARRTSAGSIREACQAGTDAAMVAMTTRVMAAAVNVAGSRGFKPYISVATN